MAEVGNPMDFVVFHSNRKDREQQQYTMTEEDRQRYINKMLEETKLKQKKEQHTKSKRTIPKNEIRAFDRLINQVADY